MKTLLEVLVSSSVLVLLVLPTAPVPADVPPPDSHPVERCVTINNLDEYPDFVLVGAIDSVFGSVHPYDELYRIRTGRCLYKGYKFNALDICAVPKSYVDDLGWGNVDLADDSVAAPCSGEIDPLGPAVSNADPRYAEDVEYAVRCIGATLTLCRTRYVSYDEGGAVLEVVEDVACLAGGDATGDGLVGAADYVVWVSHYGASDASYREGDFNCDARVDGADYTIWADHVGVGMEPGGGGGSGATASGRRACGLGFEWVAVVTVLLAMRAGRGSIREG